MCTSCLALRYLLAMLTTLQALDVTTPTVCTLVWLIRIPSNNTGHPIADAHPGNLDDIVFPGQDYNNARVFDFEDVQKWENNKRRSPTLLTRPFSVLRTFRQLIVPRTREWAGPTSASAFPGPSWTVWPFTLSIDGMLFNSRLQTFHAKVSGTTSLMTSTPTVTLASTSASRGELMAAHRMTSSVMERISLVACITIFPSAITTSWATERTRRLRSPLVPTMAPTFS